MMPHSCHTMIPWLLLVGLLLGAAPARSQNDNRDGRAEEPVRPPETTEGSSEAATQAHSGEPGPPLWKDLPLDILNDQKHFWIRPFRPQRGDLAWTATLTGTTAALLFIDQPVAREISDSPPGSEYDFARTVETLGGAAGDYAVAGSFYLIGRFSQNERARATGILGVRAVTDSFLVVKAIKEISRRPRPSRNDGTVMASDAGDFFAGGRSFPSGHSAQAWALATVVARQYSHRGWVPPTAYGLAGLVAVSRVVERKHFLADVFLGSALGYLIGRRVSGQYQGGSDHQSTWQVNPYIPERGGAAVQLILTF